MDTSTKFALGIPPVSNHFSFLKQISHRPSSTVPTSDVLKLSLTSTINIMELRGGSAQCIHGHNRLPAIENRQIQARLASYFTMQRYCGTLAGHFLHHFSCCKIIW